MITEENLKNSFLFENLSISELKSISNLCRKSNVKNGEVLIESGEILTKMYIILMGTVVLNIKKGDGIEEPVVIVGSGQIIGFEGFYNQDQKCLFTVKAIESCNVLEISYPYLEELFRKNPLISQKCLKSFHRFSSNIMNTLVAKLMDANAAKFF